MIELRKSVTLVLALLLLHFCISGTLLAASASRDLRGPDRFGILNKLIGEWKGVGRFARATAYIHKKYEYDLGGIYLVARTLDFIPPGDPSKSGGFEMHQDFSIYFKNDETGRLFVKSFFVEKFVSSEHVEIGADGKSIVIVSDGIENAPPGMRSRNTLRFNSEDQFTQTFELALPEQAYRVVEELVMSRVR